MSVENIKAFTDRISGKLSDELLQDALIYANHNEERLSIEIICDHLVEYDVPLDQEDLNFLRSLLASMNINISEPPFMYFHFS
ncbi:MafI family immunity protein [Herbaspirillum huttiense]|uniref:MafI family immunity protein n=1 Tax=Herbaspirillum huttiense TaxID=863372 RepID=UPI000EB4AAEB